MPIWKLEKRRSRIRRDKKNNKIAHLIRYCKRKTNVVLAKPSRRKLTFAVWLLALWLLALVLGSWPSVLGTRHSSLLGGKSEFGLKRLIDLFCVGIVRSNFWPDISCYPTGQRQDQRSKIRIRTATMKHTNSIAT